MRRKQLFILMLPLVAVLLTLVRLGGSWWVSEEFTTAAVVVMFYLAIPTLLAFGLGAFFEEEA